MRKKIKLKIATSLLILSVFWGCVTFVNGDSNMKNSANGMSKIENLFVHGKLLCFGRYAIYSPKHSELAWGVASFPSKIRVADASDLSIQEYVKREISKIKYENDTAEVVFSGPSENGVGWRLDYYEDKYAKRDGALFSRSYVGLGDKIFFLSAAKNGRESYDAFLSGQARRLRSLRLRESTEVPTIPGYCVENGFLESQIFDDQELVAVGLHLPNFPDVKFSISSNKNAYADYPPAEFNARLKEELSLLSRIKQAKADQGNNYPKRVVLREGTRNVQHWKGEESLIRRADGTHDFEWASVGIPKDVANPSEFSVQMFTKVSHNMIGAAEQSSLTDDEAIALWDKLLSGLKFRVKVPGAPEGSYYFLPGEKTDKGAKP